MEINRPTTQSVQEGSSDCFSNASQVLGIQNVHQHASCSCEISHISETFFFPKNKCKFSVILLEELLNNFFFFWFIDMEVSSSKLRLQQFFHDYRQLATKLQFHTNLPQHGLFLNPGSCSSCQGQSSCQTMPYKGVLATGIHVRSYYCNTLNRAPEANCSSQSKLGHLQ